MREAEEKAVLTPQTGFVVPEAAVTQFRDCGATVVRGLLDSEWLRRLEAAVSENLE